eukprot:CAMPEP_0117678086 /NCGR_PEP_ID=MMETSP0804-20121206/17090_1 /TAXON_ID=1074897 /ORGANISM="Tetraselmis astigmatica, Strain CCMP880" /LENGTH=95 /DNA_ID=CAMNT_0005487411 /DNA_START=1163 /DNA_END=1450 /DNA_ORIENTATION=-
MQPLLDVGPGGVAPRLPEVEGPRAAQRQRGDALAVPMRTDLVTVPWDGALSLTVFVKKAPRQRLSEKPSQAGPQKFNLPWDGAMADGRRRVARIS